MTKLVLQPQSEAELGEMVRSAQGPVSLRGGGTRGVAYGPGTVLETAGLSGITLYEPGALTLVAGAGTPLAEVEAVLAAQNQRLAFEAPDLRRALQRQGVSTLGWACCAARWGRRLKCRARLMDPLARRCGWRGWRHQCATARRR